MARSRGRVKVKLEGLSELAKIPGFLEQGQRRFLERAGERISDAIAEKAPGGKSGSIGRSAHSITLSPTKVAVIVDHPGAKALEEGATIKPKGKALRLRDGRFVHRSSRRRSGSAGTPPGAVFIPPRRYAKSALRRRNKIVREVFSEALDQLGKR